MAKAQISTEDSLSFIRTIRGQRVILAADLAQLFGVETKRLNEQVRRNEKRFPTDFVFQLTAAEMVESSGSQIAPLKQGQNLNYRPYAFTEHGTILKRLAELDKTLLLHDSALRDIYQRLQPLLQPAPEPPRKKIGFHAALP